MRLFRRLRSRVYAAGFALAGVLYSVGPLAAETLPPRALSTVDESAIAASNYKVNMAYQALATLWSRRFAEVGHRFAPPALFAYRGAVRTNCGIMRPDNAAYCTARNAIYFDETFLARLAEAASHELRTDGDMAAIGVIAHEMGHAVVSQLRADSRIPYENEAAADCLAGAFTHESERDGSLEEGDLEEAFFGMAAAGDPPPELTGNRRVDARILTRAALLGHGTREQRLANFTAGYEHGAGACVARLGA
jgi:predicted metalloprotease